MRRWLWSLGVLWWALVVGEWLAFVRHTPALGWMLGLLAASVGLVLGGGMLVWALFSPSGRASGKRTQARSEGTRQTKPNAL